MRLFKRMLPYYAICLALGVVCAVLVSKSVTTAAEVMAAAVRTRLPTVIVDPGHGGEDGGAVSPKGVRESGLNLEIGLRTRDLLRFLGLPVVMTRDTDVSIYSQDAQTVSEKKVSDLRNRVSLVNDAGNAILVSIHQNMFSESKYRGAQVFYSAAAGSKALAEGLQAVFDTEVDLNNHRQAKQSESIYLLSRIHCPGILVECGFLSNPEEALLLQKDGYQKRIAAAIAAAIIRQLAEPKSD